MQNTVNQQRPTFQQRPSKPQLQNIYLYEFSKFCELAEWYNINDKPYYIDAFTPLIKLYGNKPVNDIECPICHQISKPIKTVKTKLIGIIISLFGYLTLPILIGIGLILVGNSLKETITICSKCGVKFRN